ncbi:dynein light chain Tctex-type 5-B-like [Schistocerca americana]|uniref:dynein light chain Tctex-type 5-B-like n=1 Tax=Schistocerca americana TaxID=7009 RepID=UPI001F4FFDF6|nr:dynein light chain Tctex-type 5-B-like [Schistocerca americana]XP_049783662.1 dynein light chain Tctex-type 5-B-like [Schistocerca cancellata]XP_049954486.1 dynein light chain Tctex-type 5-B-like [Schistocerca serialis cubense]
MSTYQLAPRRPFNIEQVIKILHEVMETHLSTVKYEPAACPQLCAHITRNVREKVKAMNFDRYKIVVTCSIFQKENQGLHVGLRCLWDPQHDNYVSESYETTQFIALTCVYGIYHD